MSELIPTVWMLPEHANDFDSFHPEIHRCVSPFYKGEKFAVRRGRSCLNKKSEWEYEPLPSSRTDAFYRRCRFSKIEDAVAALRKAMP